MEQACLVSEPEFLPPHCSFEVGFAFPKDPKPLTYLFQRFEILEMKHFIELKKDDIRDRKSVV